MSQRKVDYKILGLLREGKTILIPICEDTTTYMKLKGKEIESDIVFSSIKKLVNENAVVWLWYWWDNDC